MQVFKPGGEAQRNFFSAVPCDGRAASVRPFAASICRCSTFCCDITHVHVLGEDVQAAIEEVHAVFVDAGRIE